MTSPETVVLLHGVGLRAWSMTRLALALRQAGFNVVNETYPSRSWTLERLASEWLPELLERVASASAPKLHFVSHSMGGIVLRLWLKRETERRGGNLPPNLGRVVMIAPPNAGSAVADRLRDFPPFRWVVGVNGPRLGTTESDVPATLGPWPEGTEGAGVIAGNSRSTRCFPTGWVAPMTARWRWPRPGWRVLPISGSCPSAIQCCPGGRSRPGWSCGFCAGEVSGKQLRHGTGFAFWAVSSK